MGFGASTPVSPHTMLAESVPIEEPKNEILSSDTSPVSCPTGVRTTIYTKTITVPEGKTEVFIAAYTTHSPSTPVVNRTAYIAIDGDDIASKSENSVYWLRVAGWTTLTPGTHDLTVDMLFPTAEGYSGLLSTAKACVMCCRAPDSKYVSFSDTDIRDALTRGKKVKVIVGVRGIRLGDGVQDCDGYVKTTDKFGNEVEEEISGDCPTNPVLHEFAFVDTLTLQVRSYDDEQAYWISYLNIIYEV